MSPATICHLLHQHAKHGHQVEVRYLNATLFMSAASALNLFRVLGMPEEFELEAVM